MARADTVGIGELAADRYELFAYHLSCFESHIWRAVE
ncbi:MAG: hypothetical protein J07HR59_00224 [Halorubrum sp. J07HR59]|nr:MAG: hypothetical protein J07HR59_00224 [Halorubrum sp. J07HR59]